MNNQKGRGDIKCDGDILKWILGQAYRAKERQAQFERRLVCAREESSSPAGSRTHELSKQKRRQRSEGAADAAIRISEIEERILSQKAEAEKAVIKTLKMIEYLPENSVEREICELRHIDLMKWRDIQSEIHMSRSQCNKRYNRAIQLLLGNENVSQVIDESRHTYLQHIRENEGIRRCQMKKIKDETQ